MTQTEIAEIQKTLGKFHKINYLTPLVSDDYYVLRHMNRGELVVLLEYTPTKSLFFMDKYDSPFSVKVLTTDGIVANVATRAITLANLCSLEGYKKD